MNVLVVDDSAVMRAMVIKSLRLSGLPLGEVHQAPNGQEGLRALNDHWIDLVLVDLNMPVMNGEEMIEHVRAKEEGSRLPILVISTEGSRTRIQALLDKGAEFLHKPFTPEKLGTAIRQLTGVTDVQQDDSGFDAGGGLDF